MNKKLAASVIAVAASATMIFTAVPVDAQAAGSGSKSADKVVDVQGQLSDTSAEYEEGQAIVMYNTTGKKKISTAAFEKELPDGIEVEEMVTFDETEENAAKTETVSEKDGALTVSLVTSDKYSTKQLISKLKNLKGVDAVSPNYIVHAEDMDEVLLSEKQDLLWGIDNEGQNGGIVDVDTNADDEGLQALESSEDETVIAIIDTGIDYTNSELASHMWKNPYPNILAGERGYNLLYDGGYYYDSEEPLDDNGHGTHCAGIIESVLQAGTSDEETANIKLMGLKFLDAEGAGDEMDAILAYKYLDTALDLGVNVAAVNNSWGGAGYDSVLDAIVTRVGEKGCVSVFAAGNDGTNNDESDVTSNLNSKYAIVVAAENESGELATFSEYGKETVDLAAPGGDILSTVAYNCFNPSIYSQDQLNELCNSLQDFDVDDVNELGILTGTSDPEGDIEVTVDHSRYITEEVQTGTEGSLQFSLNGTEGNLYRVAIPYTAISSSCTNQLSFMVSINGPEYDGVNLPGTTMIYDIPAESAGMIADCSVSFTSSSPDGFYTYGKSNCWDHLTIDRTTYKKEGERYLVFEYEASTDGPLTINIDDIGISKSGMNVEKTAAFGQLDYFNGTSMATPYVTGAAGLLAAKKDLSSLSSEERVSVILGCTRTSDNLTDKVSTGGALDLSLLGSGAYKLKPLISDVKADGTNAVISGIFLTGYECTVTVDGQPVECTENSEDGTLTFDAADNLNKYVTVTVTNPKSNKSDETNVYLGSSQKEVTELGDASYYLYTIDGMTTDGNMIYIISEGVLYQSYIGGDEEEEEDATFLMMDEITLDASVFADSTIDDSYNTAISVHGDQMVCMDGKVYLFAEYCQLNSSEMIMQRDRRLLCYDPDSDEPWSEVTIPEEYQNTDALNFAQVDGQTIGAYNGKLYVMGGYNSVTDTATDQIVVYDPEDGSWGISTETLPEAQFGGQAIQIGNNLVYTLGATSEMTAATDAEGAYIKPAKTMVFDGTEWKVSEADVKCYRFEEVTYGSKTFYKADATLGVTADGVLYTGMTAEGLGNVFTYSLSDDKYIASGYNLDQNGDAADTEYAGTVIANVLLAVQTIPGEPAKVYGAEVENGMVTLSVNSAAGLYANQDYYLPGSKITVKAYVQNNKYYLKNGVVQDKDGHTAKLNAKNRATIRATSTVSLKAGSVYKYVQKITLNKKSLSVSYAKTKTVKLSATVTPKSTATYPVNSQISWVSSNKKYATVTSAGKVTIKKAGIGHTVKITAKAKDGSGKKAVCKIKIK